MSADALIADFERRKSRALGNARRREAGLYYTPPELASFVVELALRYGRGSVLDPCAGAGAFLLAAARAGVGDLRGIDLDAAALRVARKVVPQAVLLRGDSLRIDVEPADLVISNPPYGHVRDAWLARRFPALKGGEIDRYAAFILRSLELVRPGGVVALLIPDTWMFLSRAWRLRGAVLEAARIAAIVDLEKPFASAKDTRVQALVLVRKPAEVRQIYVARGRDPLAPVRGLTAAPWFVYRTREEAALCDAMERASVPLGSVCEVGYGLRTGNNALHVARRAPKTGEIGLVSGEDIGSEWKPKTLVKPGSLLALARRQLGRPRVAIQRIRTNSKAPWARWLEAALVPPDLVCLDSLSTLAAPSSDLLKALLALVTSVPMNRWHRLHTTDVNVKPSALRMLPVPRALVDDPRRLARLTDPRAIDAEVYALFGLRRELVEACERGFWEKRFPEEFQLLGQAMSDPPCSVARKEGTA